MSSAKGYYDSQYGRIESEWKLEGKRLTYKATVPANTSATLYLPAVSSKAVLESGNPLEKVKGIKVLKSENGKVVAEVSSGTYSFVVQQ